MFTTSAGHSEDLNKMICTDKYTELISDVKKLEPENWPHDASVVFADDSVRALCKQFDVDTNACLHSFREFMRNGGKAVPEELCPLLNAVATIPISTAECERGFSAMNLIVTPTRTCLNVHRIAALMHIRLIGPPLTQWNPVPYVRSWLREGHRSATHVNCMARQAPQDEISPLWKFL